MGTYLSPGADRFADIRRNNYVDKTSFLHFVNEQIEIGWPDNLLCITRLQQFGKTFAAQMLTAYYVRSCNSEALFQSLQISENPSFRQSRS